MDALPPVLGRQRRLELPNAVAAQPIPTVGRFGVLPVVRHVELRTVAQRAIGPRVFLVEAQIQDVAMPPVPIEIVPAVLQAVRIETPVLLSQIADGIGAGQESIFAGGVQTVVLGDVPGLAFSARCGARAVLPDLLHRGDRHPVAQRVDRRHRVVVHVPAVVVETLRDGVQGDVPEPDRQAHAVPDRAVRSGDRAAHRVTVVVELANWIGQFPAVQDHRRSLAPRDVVPVENRPAFLRRRRPRRRDAVNQTVHVRVIGVGVRDDLQVADLSRARRGVNRSHNDADQGQSKPATRETPRPADQKAQRTHGWHPFHERRSVVQISSLAAGGTSG